MASRVVPGRVAFEPMPGFVVAAWLVGLFADVGPAGATEPPSHSLDTPALPLAPAPTEPRQARRGEPEILYVNFDGAVLQSGCGNDARYDCSTLADLFDGYVGPFTGNLNQRMAILQATRKAVADFGIRVIVDRPPDDVEYTMVIYGDLGPQSFAGIAPYIDCNDLHRSDTSFTQAFSGSNTGSTVILQEAAHTWGLEHVDSERDILNPFKASSTTQRFLDECLRIVANTELQPTAGACNQVHTQFCGDLGPGYQNSYREMLALFGPPIPDTQPPELEITFPADEAVFTYPATLSLSGAISDDLHPQFYDVQIYVNGDLVYEDEQALLDLVLVNPQPDDYDIRVVITDDGGNSTEDRVSFTILPEGSEVPQDDLFPDSVDDGSCSVEPRRSALWMLWLPLLGWSSSRRR